MPPLPLHHGITVTEVSVMDHQQPLDQNSIYIVLTLRLTAFPQTHVGNRAWELQWKNLGDLLTSSCIITGPGLEDTTL